MAKNLVGLLSDSGVRILKINENINTFCIVWREFEKAKYKRFRGNKERFGREDKANKWVDWKR